MNARRVATGIAGAAGLIAAFTLLSRLAGFARYLVFAESVRSGGVGTIYQSVNALPNVVFEVAAGGVLAAAAVPLIAHRIGTGERDRADHAASVLLTWVLVVLVPLGALLAVAARPLSTLLVTGDDPEALDVAVRLLRIFAVQVPLYGVGIILTGLLHAHRRFLAAALAPFLSSVVVLVSYLWYGSITDGEVQPGLVPDEAIAVLGWGTTLGVVVLSLPLIAPALATGWRWRPSLRLPPEDARRVGTLAGAGVLALAAQQLAVLVTMRLANFAGGDAAFTVYTYVQAVYLLPYAVLAVPVAQSAFPSLATRTGAGEDVSGTLSRSLRAVLALTGVAAGVLIAAAPAIGAFFGILDARRGPDGASPEALAAMPAALTAYAPGLVGFGLVALLTRALYVRGRPLDAGMAAALGWVVAAVPPVLFVGPDAGPAVTLWVLGVFSAIGMSVAGFGLVLLVRRAWGPAATEGATRTLGAVVVALAVEWIVGDLVTHGRSFDTLTETVLIGLGAGFAALVAGVLVLGVGDRGMMQEVRARGRARRHAGGDR
jgi:putative peptidoglycan lipid II flippase